MSAISRDLIEYIGIADYTPMNVSEVSAIQIDRIENLPRNKPDIKEISKVSVSASIINKSIVKSTVGTSLDGCVAKGYKFIGEVSVKWRVEYASNELSESIYSTTGKCFVTAVVSIPYNDILQSAIVANILMDDINIELLDSRAFSINITGIVVVE